MNRTIKRCLLGLVVTSAMFGTTWAQGQEPEGTVRLGPKGRVTQSNQSVYPAQTPTLSEVPLSSGSMQPTELSQSPGLMSPQYQGPPAGFQGPTIGTMDSQGQFGIPPQFDQMRQPGPGSYQMNPVDRVFTTRFNVDSRGGGLYGYNAGYSNIGAFVPYKIDDTSLFFATGQALLTYDSRGGATVGAGYRHWMEELDRIVGLAAFYDFDNGHAQAYQQLGFSFESLGRYADLRVNGYAPVGNATHVLGTTLTSVTSLSGNAINLAQSNTIEQSYGGLDAEVGGPTPILGRYGLNAYIGGYYLMSNGVVGGNTSGVSGRLQSQINEDVSFGVQVTNDHLFGLNTQFQVFVNLPNGRPSQWLRNLRVQDRLVQNVFRQNRVLAKEITYTSQVEAIDRNSNKPYFVAYINPNSAAGGNGTVEHPFNSIAAYEAQSAAKQQQYDLILVSPGTALTNANLNTNSMLNIYDNQRLLATTTAQTFTAANLPGQTLSIPAFSSGLAPTLFSGSSQAGNVVTLVGGNTHIEQVSGFNIKGNSLQTNIAGKNNTAVTIDNNTISGGVNGVYLQNLSGTILSNTNAKIFNNTFTGNLGNGLQVTNTGAPNLEVVVTNNTFSSNGGDGLRLDALNGSSIGGTIGGRNSAATATAAAVNNTNTFDSNSGNGLNLTSNSGTLNFLSSTNPSFGIFSNTFTSNKLNGMNVSSVGNSANSFIVENNTFGATAKGNLNYGIGLSANGGTTTIVIGAADVPATKTTPTITNSNTFTNNAVSAIDLAVAGTGVLNYNISNNSITNSAAATVAAPHDAFSFLFDGTSGVNPFTVTNNSDAGVSITALTWNLAGTTATFNGGTAVVGGSTGTPLIQPISGTDTTTGLTTVDGTAVLAGTNPLVTNVAGSATNGVASFANLGTTQFTPSLSLGFKSFTNGTNFTADSQLTQTNNTTSLTSQATIGSTVTATFSNGISSTVKLASVPSTDGLAVGATGTAFGPSTPGFGSGLDGVHVIASGASTVNTANIQNNVINGYGQFGIHVETAGTANASNVVISGNTVQSNGTGINGSGVATFTGGGIDFNRVDSSTLTAILAANTITSNFNHGLVLTGDGTSTGGLTVNSWDNTATGNAGNGLCIASAGVGTPVTLNSFRDNFSGSGSAKNSLVTGGDNIVFLTRGSSVTTANFNNVLANSAVGNGLSATTSESSVLNINVNSYFDPLLPAGTGSSFASNGKSGALFNINNTSTVSFNVSSPLVAGASSLGTSFANNTGDGITINRSGGSLLSNWTIQNSSLSNNGGYGLVYNGLGSGPNDSVSPGTPNQINLISDTLNFNGSAGTGGDGARVILSGSAELLLNAMATTFNNNTSNGLRIDENPGSEFGYIEGNKRSTFDNVSFNNNGTNGVRIVSQFIPNFGATTTPPPPGGNSIRPYSPSSTTFMQISANTGNTQINNNSGDGVLLRFLNGRHDILIEGQGLTGTTYSTTIQGNTKDGISSQAGSGTSPVDSGNPQDGVLLTVNNVTIGIADPSSAAGSKGSLGKGNGGNGIDFEVQSVMTVNGVRDTDPNVTWDMADGGTASLVVNNSAVQGNVLDGIRLIGNTLEQNADGTRTTYNEFRSGFSNAVLNATINNTKISLNGGDGVNIDLQGEIGNFFGGPTFSGLRNHFVLTNDTVSNNGVYGVFMEQNAAIDIRSTDVNPNFRQVNFVDPQPTNPPGPFNPANLAGVGNFNGTWNAGLSGVGFNPSGFMNLETAINSSLVMTGNTINGNGTLKNLQQADGVFIRVGTNSGLSADVRNNQFIGNTANDFHLEGFVAYNPVTGVSPQPTGSVAAALPAADKIVLDDSAQLYLRFTGNTGNVLNINGPNILSSSGNTSPIGAVYAADPLKDQFSFTTPSPRSAQIFEVDNQSLLDSTNKFSNLNGVGGNTVFNAFSNADYFLGSATDAATFPNPTFPLSYSSTPTSAENPFVP